MLHPGRVCMYTMYVQCRCKRDLPARKFRDVKVCARASVLTERIKVARARRAVFISAAHTPYRHARFDIQVPLNNAHRGKRCGYLREGHGRPRLRPEREVTVDCFEGCAADYFEV